MKKLILIILILNSLFSSHAQNYQCLQSGVKRYFINSNGYLRGMRIDSVRTSGSDVIYYPFHTARGNYLSGSTLDSNGGSWLGKKVIQKTDGTFLFDNIWNDTVIVKTQAHTGDIWAFYTDTTSHHYIATVTSEDTMTVLGSLDSIKTIRINAYNGSVLDLTDSLNNFQIILSKNNGFVKMFDLHTFPYHAPDTSFYFGVDYYLDYLIHPWLCGFSAPAHGTSNSIFSLVLLVNPTYSQLYDWNVGEVFEFQTFTQHIPSEGNYPHGYYFDSITAKTIIPGGVQYSYSGWKAEAHIHPLAIIRGTFSPSSSFPYDTLSIIGGVFTVFDNLLIDTSKMSEEKEHYYMLHYLPNDTTFCGQANKYILYRSNIQDYGFSYHTEGCDISRTYKTGLGLLNYHWDFLGGYPPKLEDTTLIYCVKRGIPCGHYTYPSPINYIAGINEFNKPSFTLLPNPASDELTIKTNSTQPYTITLQNMLGQTVLKQHATKQQETINVSDLPAGVYNISIADETGSRHNEKLLIAH